MTRLQAIQSTIADNKVVVYSATYCPYCSQVRALLPIILIAGSAPKGQTALLVTMQHTNAVVV
jgi:hypothetical protein